LPRELNVFIHTESIALGALLKWTRVTASGGQAKNVIAGGRVRVNGIVETRRGRQVRPGDLVSIEASVALRVRRGAGVPTPPPVASRVS
jgi:ribosome-associated protein